MAGSAVPQQSPFPAGLADLPSKIHPCLPHRFHPVYGSYHLPQCSGTLPLLSSSLASQNTTLGTSGGAGSGGDSLERELIRAVTANELDTVRELLTTQSDSLNAAHLNALSPATGFAPLHYAAARGFLDVFKLLVARGANTSLADREGETSLIKAAERGHTEMLREIVANASVDVNHRDRDGWSALHNCTSKGHLFAARALIEAGANVDAQSRTGHTPLMGASAKGFVDLVELLLEKGADPLIRTKFEDTAYDLAAQGEEPYICELLQVAEQKVLERRLAESGAPRASAGPLMNRHNTVVEVIYENQRSTFFARQFSRENLTKSDIRGPWCTPLGRPCPLDDVHLPQVRDSNSGQLVRGWYWLSDWQPDTKHPRVDPVDGWQYAKTFEDPPLQWLAAPIGTVLNSWVRRRRWFRIRKRRADVGVEEDSTIASPTSNDYLARARATIATLPASQDSHDLTAVRKELDLYQDVIHQLLEGLKVDLMQDRKRAASTLVSTYLEHAEELTALVDALEQAEESEDVQVASPISADPRNKGKGPADPIDRGT
ncbi:hypothetical protein HKX48_001022 [Thoreauomyces humboldtii]|nr:hypothetical protein HKX48_001022 [Thoreauomyces humboldtii]